MFAQRFEVSSDSVRHEENFLFTNYVYNSTSVSIEPNGTAIVTPTSNQFTFKTDQNVPKVGVMIVGLGGNNGTTLTAGVLANKLKLQWQTRTGVKKANYIGSLTQSATTYLGDSANHKPVYAPFKSLLPMVDPNELIIGGWDISSANLYEATLRAQVHEPDLIQQLADQLKVIQPLPSIFDLNFVAPNQKDRADNVLNGTKSQLIDQVRQQIRAFKSANSVEKVIILWSANTERYMEIDPEIHGTEEKLFAAIERNETEVSPSLLFAIASVFENCPYINGSPQNTFVDGFREFAIKKNVPFMGDDFKTGQTKFKSAVADFLISSGLKLTAVASYNHLGNNDGLNLSFHKCFRSKEISKSSVIDDIVESNPILYPDGEKPDHIVVIKYVPSVGDSKRALDEYDSEIFCGGRQVISVHNTCEDSLLAAPVMLDLIILMELFTRVQLLAPGRSKFTSMHCVMSVISFLLKAPIVPPGTQVVNSLYQQRSCLENILRACRGLQPISNMRLNDKLQN